LLNKIADAFVRVGVNLTFDELSNLRGIQPFNAILSNVFEPEIPQNDLVTKKYHFRLSIFFQRSEVKSDGDARVLDV